MDPVVPITVISLILGALIAFVVFGSYFRKTKSEVEAIAKPEKVINQKPTKHSQLNSKKSHSKPHSHTDKVPTHLQLHF